MDEYHGPWVYEMDWGYGYTSHVYNLNTTEGDFFRYKVIDDYDNKVVTTGSGKRQRKEVSELFKKGYTAWINSKQQ